MAIKASRRSAISPFYAMEVLKAANERAAAGADVIHLEIGEPSTGAPGPVIEAAVTALREAPLGYTEALGVPDLRARIARHYGEAYGIDVAPSRIVLTNGSSGGFLLSFLASFDIGDRVALTAPGYPAYRNILSALSIEPVCLASGPEDRFQPTPALLEADAGAGALDGLLIASPANPTGTMLSSSALEELLDYCAAKRIRVISDEIYHGIAYGERAETALAFNDHAIVINSFSKYYCMTGWRLGWMVLPEDLVRTIERLAQNLFISPPTLAQLAGGHAFDCGDELDLNVERYARNRELLLKELPAAGFNRLAPADGAFYLFADVRKLTNDSTAFCKDMLAQTGVAATPGVDFDVDRGSAYVRFCFAGATEDMAEAARRLRKWLA